MVTCFFEETESGLAECKNGEAGAKTCILLGTREGHDDMFFAKYTMQ